MAQPYVTSLGHGYYICYSDLAGLDFIVLIEGGRKDLAESSIELIINNAIADWIDGNDNDMGYIGLVERRLLDAGIECVAYVKEEGE